MRRELIGSLAALVLVAACQTAPETASDVSTEGGAAGGSATSQPSAVQQALPAAPVTQTMAAPAPPPPAPTGPAPTSQEYFVIEVGDRVFFSFNEFNLPDRARKTLGRQAEWLRANPSVRVAIEGHADERGTREYNLALAERRANSVLNYLVELGVDPERLSVISFGKEKPAAIGSNETAWALNRRAVTAISGGAAVN
jgi:peptidoglycan-associated lipoprotein